MAICPKNFKPSGMMPMANCTANFKPSGMLPVTICATKFKTSRMTPIAICATSFQPCNNSPSTSQNAHDPGQRARKVGPNANASAQITMASTPLRTWRGKCQHQTVGRVIVGRQRLARVAKPLTEIDCGNARRAEDDAQQQAESDTGLRREVDGGPNRAGDDDGPADHTEHDGNERLHDRTPRLPTLFAADSMMIATAGAMVIAAPIASGVA